MCFQMITPRTRKQSFQIQDTKSKVTIHVVYNIVFFSANNLPSFTFRFRKQFEYTGTIRNEHARIEHIYSTSRASVLRIIFQTLNDMCNFRLSTYGRTYPFWCVSVYNMLDCAQKCECLLVVRRKQHPVFRKNDRANAEGSMRRVLGVRGAPAVLSSYGLETRLPSFNEHVKHRALYSWKGFAAP